MKNNRDDERDFEEYYKQSKRDFSLEKHDESSSRYDFLAGRKDMISMAMSEEICDQKCAEELVLALRGMVPASEVEKAYERGISKAYPVAAEAIAKAKGIEIERMQTFWELICTARVNDERERCIQKLVDMVSYPNEKSA